MNVDQVRQILADFDPRGDKYLASCQTDIIRLLQQHPEALSREHYSPGHLTASAVILSPSKEDVLLVHHKKLGKWLQPGGHVEETDDHPSHTAKREAEEETGVRLTSDEGRLLGIDIHSIPATEGEPQHLHHDLAFLFTAQTEVLGGNRESNDVFWCPIDRLSEYTNDDAVARHVGRAIRQ